MRVPALLRGWPVLAAVVMLGVVVFAATGGAGARVGSRPTGTYLVDGGCRANNSGTSGSGANGSGANGSGAGARNCRPSPAPSVHNKGRAPDAPVLVGLFSGFGIAVSVVLVIMAVAFLVAISTAAGSISIRRRRLEAAVAADSDPGAGSPVDVVGRLDAAAAAGLADLAGGSDPRRAVIAAWLRLEQAAAAVGTVRRAAETPGELAGRILADHAVSPVTLAGLAALYREARYSEHPVTERMRADARRALERLRRELTAAVPG